MSISPVYINGFHQATNHPGPQKNHMVAENNNSNKKASPKDECFQGMCIFCLHSKWRLERENSHHCHVYVLPNQSHHFAMFSLSHYPTRLQHNKENNAGGKGNGVIELPITHVFSSSLEKQYSKFITIITLLVIPNTSLLGEELKTFI